MRDEDLRSALDRAGAAAFEWTASTGQVRSLHGVALEQIHPEDRAGFERALRATQGSGTPLQHDFRVTSADARVHWMTARGAATATGDVQGVIMACSPAHARGIERLSRLFAALRHVNHVTATAVSRDELLGAVCRTLCEVGGFRMSWIGWREPATSQVLPVAVWGDDARYLQAIEVFADERPEGRGPAGTAMRERRPSISNDLLQDPRLQPWHAELLPRSYRSVAAFPVHEAGEVRGVLTVYAAEVDFFRDDEIALLSEAASTLSLAIDRFAREQARYEAEVRLRQERDFSDAVLRSLPGVLYMYDDDGRFLRWNENFEQACGYTRAEITTIHPLELFAHGDRSDVAQRIDDVFDLGAASVDAPLLAKDGSLTPFHFTGVKTTVAGRQCLIGVGIDLSARHRAEAAQVASEARYRTLFDHAPDGILIADRELRCVDANPAICNLLGYARGELVGRHANDIVPIAADRYEGWQLRRKDGSSLPADVISTVMPDGNALSLVRDVTQRKQHELSLRELNESLETKVLVRTRELADALVRAEAADHLKSAFLATMSHELRTPLNSIIGFTGILLANMAGPLTEEQQSQLGIVRSSAQHLHELINDVLDISKIEAGQLETHPTAFAVRPSIERVMGMVAPLAAAKHLTLDAFVAPSVREMVSDRRRVEQILLNLLNNAIKFTNEGSVTLSAEILVAEQVVQMRVSDTGIGIAADDLSTLFQPFRQLDTGLARRFQGTGLGLAICRRLVTLLGGSIAATSVLGRGSEFTVRLPVTETTP